MAERVSGLLNLDEITSDGTEPDLQYRAGLFRIARLFPFRSRLIATTSGTAIQLTSRKLTVTSRDARINEAFMKTPPRTT